MWVHTMVRPALKRGVSVRVHTMIRPALEEGCECAGTHYDMASSAVHRLHRATVGQAVQWSSLPWLSGPGEGN